VVQGTASSYPACRIREQFNHEFQKDTLGFLGMCAKSFLAEYVCGKGESLTDNNNHVQHNATATGMKSTATQAQQPDQLYYTPSI